MHLLDRLLQPSVTIRFSFLFVALILMLAVPVFLPPGLVSISWPTLFTLLALAALATVARERRTLVIGIALAAPAILLSWIQLIIGPAEPAIAGKIFGVLFLLYLAGTLLRHILRATQVTTEALFAVASVYLLFALIWAMAYGITETLDPEAFSVALGGEEPGWMSGETGKNDGHLTYFSFVTLTTLGYGDITPASDLARLLAMMEAMLGQLFLVIIVARLVGIHATQQRT
jgi:voltage-gated potassium channel Kch